MDFRKLTLDGPIDTGALTSAISEQDLNKIKLLAPEAITDTGPAPNFQIMVANGQLETPIGTVCLTFEVADFMFKENFIVMKVLPNPLIGLCFLKRNNAIFEIRQWSITFSTFINATETRTQSSNTTINTTTCKSSTTYYNRLLLHTETKSRYTSNENSVPRIPLNRSLQNRKSPT